MSSKPRRIQRKFIRKLEDYAPNPQPVINLANGGYRTLRPTKGWATFTAKRLQAIALTNLLRSGIGNKVAV